jgi:hypothetical protein
MPTIKTLVKGTPFSYEGSVAKGVTINYSGQPRITAAFFAFMLNQLQGKTLKTGFSADNPPRGGFGEWLKQNSQRLKTRKLTPRHGSHIAAILEHEGYVSYRAGSLTFKR